LYTKLRKEILRFKGVIEIIYNAANIYKGNKPQIILYNFQLLE